MKIGDMVRISWLDATHDKEPWRCGAEAQAEAVAQALMTYHTVGILVYQDEHVFMLASTTAGDEDWGGVSSIPRGCVTEIRGLEVMM